MNHWCVFSLLLWESVQRKVCPVCRLRPKELSNTLCFRLLQPAHVSGEMDWILIRPKPSFPTPPAVAGSRNLAEGHWAFVTSHGKCYYLGMGTETWVDSNLFSKLEELFFFVTGIWTREVCCHVINAGFYLETIKEANPRTKLAGWGHRAERYRESFYSCDSFMRRAHLTAGCLVL